MRILFLIFILVIWSNSTFAISNPFMHYCNKFLGTEKRDTQGARELYIMHSITALITTVEKSSLTGLVKNGRGCDYYFRKINRLNSLKLSGKKLRNIEVLASFTNLKTLLINNNRIKDISPLKNLKKLYALSIEKNSIEDLTPLIGHPMLHHIYAERNPIKSFSILAKNRSLMFVDYGGKQYSKKDFRTIDIDNRFYSDRRNQHAPISCPATELRLDKGPGFRSFDRKKPSHQYFGNCYAHAAANLVDHHRLSRGTFTSATFAPVSHNYMAMKRMEKGKLSSGYADVTLNVMKYSDDGKFCKSIAVKKAILKMVLPPNFSFSLAKVKKLPEGIFFDFLFKIYKTGLLESFLKLIKNLTPKQFKAYIKTNQSSDFIRAYNEFVERIAVACSNCRRSSDKQYEHLFKNIVTVLRSFIKERDLDSKNFLPFLRKILGKECVGDNLVKVDYKVEWAPKETKARPWVKWIRDQLVNKHDPVSISYCSNILDGVTTFASRIPVSTRRSYRDGIRRFTKFKKKCGGHSSAIIGIRKNRTTGRCQFLLRNSWGKWCKKYSSTSKHRIECKNGSFWIDSLLIHNAMKPGGNPIVIK